MPKAKKTTSKKAVTPAKSVPKKEVTINLDTFAIPIAIIIVGIMLSLTIFFVSKGNRDNTNTQGANPTVDETDDSGIGGDVTLALGDDPYIGDKKKAKVAVIEFSDYQCGYCKRHTDETFPELKANYVDTGDIIYVYKEFPLSDSGLGYDTAVAGTCVFEQLGGDKFSEFHSGSMGLASAEDVRAQAIAVGVDGGKYDTCVSSVKFKDEIEADKAEGGSVGIQGTPGFVVGLIDDNGNVTGPIIAGAYPYETFQSAIDALLK